MKLDNKGFVLTEVLIVSTVIISILTFMYIQFKNVNRSYQNSFSYDTVEGLYLANNIINYINEDNYDTLVAKLQGESQGYIDITNCDIDLFETSSYCEQLFEKSEVEQILFTQENLFKIKENSSNLNNDIKNYIKQIKTINSQTDYRIIIKYKNNTFTSLRFNKGNEYVQKGLIAYLDGINNTGSGHSDTTITWRDLSGNNNDATLYNNPTWNSNSIIFDGQTNYGLLTNTANQEFSNGMTLEIRVKILSFNGKNTGTGHIEYFGNWQGAGGGFVFETSYINRFRLTNGAEARPTFTSNLNEYYTVVATYDNNELKLYVNGIESASASASGSITPSTAPFGLGGNPAGSPTFMDWYANVEFQNVLIYDRALTENEIQRNYQADIARY